MAINVNFEPINEILNLASQAGSNEAEWRQQELEQQTMMAKIQHDTAMHRMEFEAQTQADTQFREQRFQQAIRGEQFKRGQLTLQEQYGWDLQLDRAKAQIALESKIKEHAQKVQEWQAQRKLIEDSKILSDEQKTALISAGDYRAGTGSSLPTGFSTTHQATVDINGTPTVIQTSMLGGQRQLGPSASASAPKTSENINRLMQGRQLIASITPQPGQEAAHAEQLQWYDQEIARQQRLENKMTGMPEQPQAPTATKQLDKVTAQAILAEAGGDKEKAREIAKERGYTF